MTEKGASEKAYIPCAVGRQYFDKISSLKPLEEDYNLVLWPEFLRDFDSLRGKIEVILVCVMDMQPISEEMLKGMPNLKTVATASVGTDHLDLPLLKKFGIKIANTPGVTIQPTADLAMALLMSLARRIPELMDITRDYKEGAGLDPRGNLDFLGCDIHHSTIGILGMGQIGLEIARRAKGFRMDILYHNRHQRSKEDEEEVGARFCPLLEELLPRVDFLVLSAPLTKETRNMIRGEQFQMMKPTSKLINIARGPLVNTDDLVVALESGTIAGAALDTTDPEPLPEHHPLLRMRNVIVTPHAGVFTTGGLNQLYGLAADNVKAALEGRQMPGQIEY